MFVKRFVEYWAIADVMIYPVSLDATGMQLAVVVARFNHLVSARLLQGCSETFCELGGRLADLHVAWVPGAFEIPQAARMLAQSGRYNAVVTLGSVIRGGTPHFDYVAGAAATGASQVALSTGVPVAFGVLTTDTVEQALERAGVEGSNKGSEAALAAIEMVGVVAGIEAG